MTEITIRWECKPPQRGGRKLCAQKVHYQSASPRALEAVFDGTALQLEEPLNLATGTRVTIIIESVLPNEVKPPKTFLETAQSLQLQGESDKMALSNWKMLRISTGTEMTLTCPEPSRRVARIAWHLSCSDNAKLQLLCVLQITFLFLYSGMQSNEVYCNKLWVSLSKTLSVSHSSEYRYIQKESKLGRL